MGLFSKMDLKSLAATALSAGLAAELAQLSVPGQWRQVHVQVGQETGLDPNLLHALQLHENYQGDPNAVSPVNANGTRDHGLMQINDANFGLLGVDASSVLDPLTNVRAAASLVKQNMARAPQLGLLAQISIYNAGFSTHRNPDGSLRAKVDGNGALSNQKYVVGVATWYALIVVASFAPIKTPGWKAAA